MTIQIALLRGVNVGGHQAVAMSELRNLATEFGFGGARSILQSGNLIFRCDARTGVDLENLLEREAEKRLGFHADFFIRSAKEWREVVARNPFRKDAERDPSHLVVMFLKSAVNTKNVKVLQAAIAGSEIVRADGRHLYIVYPDGIGRSRLTNALIEKKLGIRGTARNWNTVLKLAALADEETD
ncbi:DUF1697 domain-containing protein [Candidatus Binatus sp.]|uniref:DUF1697 domain-containing protein n=1 Tax=Candidatus Binatus sp. TaxID=2811406 RepID=UPI003BB0825B